MFGETALTVTGTSPSKSFVVMLVSWMYSTVALRRNKTRSHCRALRPADAKQVRVVVQVREDAVDLRGDPLRHVLSAVRRCVDEKAERSFIPIGTSRLAMNVCATHTGLLVDSSSMSGGRNPTAWHPVSTRPSRPVCSQPGGFSYSMRS